MTTFAIIQARIGSTRFPGKVLERLRGRTLVDWVAERVGAAAQLNRVVWAIPAGSSDDSLADHLDSFDQLVFRGSEDDVLSRYAGAADHFPADAYVRLTADDPLIPTDLIDEAIIQFNSQRVDYLATTYPVSLIPDGFDVEVFTAAALLQANCDAYRLSDREHVTKYIWTNPDRFQLGTFEPPVSDDLSRFRFAIDTPEDLQVAELLAVDPVPDSYETAAARYAACEEEIQSIRGEAVINAGLEKSLQTDLTKLLANGRCFTKSDDLLKRSKKVIPGAAQTFSKGFTQFSAGAAPLFIERAKDCFVWDVDGNAYIDYIMGIGPVLLGHSCEAVDRPVREQMDRMLCPSISSRLEVEVAERLVKLSPWTEAMVRFAKNGSDVTTGAMRVARAFTGRERVICGGYHGWHDWYIGSTSRNAGVPKSTIELTTALNVFDFERLESELKANDVAAVILEPMSSLVPTQQQIETLMQRCRQHGTLVVFDECWTGFRVHEFGACSYYGVQPDLACFGKGCANGYPSSFLIGRPDIMRLFSDVFFSFTFAGDAIGLAAIDAVLDVVEKEPAYPILEANGQRLWDGIVSRIASNDLKEQFGVIGYAQKPLLQIKVTEGRNLLRTFASEHFASHGILFGGYHVLSKCHTAEVIDYTLQVYDSFFSQIARSRTPKSLEKLVRGRVVEDVFRQH